MRIRPFEYHPAADLEEALAILAQEGPGARLLAGGTDLLLDMKHGRNPGLVVGLGGVSELSGRSINHGVARLGCLTTHARLAGDRELAQRLPILTSAVGLIGSWQIRNVATLGGNLGHASPAADSAGPLLALDASVEVLSQSGRRNIPLAEFFTGPGQTCLEPDELLKEVVIPLPQTGSAGRYLKLMRKNAVDLALLGVAVQATLDESGEKLARVAIGLGGLAPAPIRAPEAEALFAGLSLAEATQAIDQAAELAVSATKPIDDVRASAEYRQTVTRAYVQRGLTQALAELSGKGVAS